MRSIPGDTLPLVLVQHKCYRIWRGENLPRAKCKHIVTKWFSANKSQNIGEGFILKHIPMKMDRGEGELGIASWAGCRISAGWSLVQRKRWGYIKKPFEKETLVMLKQPLGFEIWKAWPSVFSPGSFSKLLGYEIISN